MEGTAQPLYSFPNYFDSRFVLDSNKECARLREKVMDKIKKNIGSRHFAVPVSEFHEFVVDKVANELGPRGFHVTVLKHPKELSNQRSGAKQHEKETIDVSCGPKLMALVAHHTNPKDRSERTSDYDNVEEFKAYIDSYLNDETEHREVESVFTRLKNKILRRSVSDETSSTENSCEESDQPESQPDEGLKKSVTTA